MYKPFFYFLLFFVLENNLYAQLEEKKAIISTNDSAVLSRLNTIHFKKYINKPLEPLIDALRSVDSIQYVYSTEPPCVLSSIDYNFGVKRTKVSVVIILKDLKYQNQFQPKCNWNYQELQKEIVSEILIEIDGFYNPWYSTKCATRRLKKKNITYSSNVY